MEKFRLSIKDSTLSYIIAFFACMFLSSILSLLIFSILSLFSTIDTKGPIETLISMSVSNGLMLSVFFIFNKQKDNRLMKKPAVKKIIFYLIIAVAAFFALSPIINLTSIWFNELGFKLNEFPYDLTNTNNYLISLISYVLLPAICEELLFRGLVFKGLKKLGKSTSIVLSAILFSLFHVAINQTIYPFLMGLVLALVMYREDNILYPILIHIINNFLSLTFSHFNISVYFNHWSFYLIAIVACIIFLTIVVSCIIINNKSTPKTKPTKEELLYIIITISIMITIWLAYNIMTLFIV